MAAARSRALLAALETRLANALADAPEVYCVAAAGSLARLESGADSDLDALIVTRAPSAAPDALVARVYGTLSGLPLRAPKASGIYVAPVTVESLLDPRARGALDETPANFGRRFQFLLEARPVYGQREHARLQRRILEWYAGDAADLDLMLHDLQRYRHAYAAWQTCKFDRSDEDGWYLRQIKLHSARLLGFTGLLLLLAESARRRDRLDWLAARLPLTPLERLRTVIGTYDPLTLARIEFHYEWIVARLCVPAVRAALVAASPTAATAPAPRPAIYAELDAHAAALRELLTRFVLARAGGWPLSFYAALCC